MKSYQRVLKQVDTPKVTRIGKVEKSFEDIQTLLLVYSLNRNGFNVIKNDLSFTDSEKVDI